MRVRCTLPNATSPINGVAFETAQDGSLVSAPIDTDTTKHFLSIPGYVAIPELDVPPPERSVAVGAEPAVEPPKKPAAK